jgi:hypothetical protein
MTRLEERYRRVLRLLPAWYREVWEEDMVSTFLATVDSDPEYAEYAVDYGRPSWSEVGSIVALAVRLRLGSAGAPPRYAAWGEAVRLAVLSGVLVNAAGFAVGLVNMLWEAGLLPMLPPSPVLALEVPPPHPYTWQTALALLGALWLPAFLALVFGRWATARRLASLAVAANVVSLVATAVDTGPVSTSYFYDVLTSLLLVLAMSAFHRDAPPVPRGSWLVALGAGIALVTGLQVLHLSSTTVIPPLDWIGLWCVVLVAAAAVHLAARALGWLGRYSAWAPALSILAVAVLGARLLALLDYARFGAHGWHPATIPLAVAEAVAVVAAAVPLTILATRTLRRLPAVGAHTW